MKMNNKGFTLIEILVVLAISGIVLGAIYQTYHSQQKSYIVQEEIAKMQQNLRAAMFMITSELRMAGFDPSGSTSAGIVPGQWTATSLQFTKDVNSDGTIASTDGSNETVRYWIDGNMNLIRTESTNQIVASNIEAINFYYLQEDTTTQATVVEDIRSIEVTLVARSGRSEEGYTNPFIYQNQQGQTILAHGGDNVRRMLLTTQVKCRNLGL